MDNSESMVEITITVKAKVGSWMLTALMQGARELTPMDGRLTIEVDGEQEASRR